MQSGVGAPPEINGALLRKREQAQFTSDGSGRLENVHLRPGQVSRLFITLNFNSLSKVESLARKSMIVHLEVQCGQLGLSNQQAAPMADHEHLNPRRGEASNGLPGIFARSGQTVQSHIKLVTGRGRPVGRGAKCRRKCPNCRRR